MARAGLDQATPVMTGDRLAAAPAYLVRRESGPHDDERGSTAAVRERFRRIRPVVIMIGGTLGPAGLAVNAGLSTSAHVNKQNSLVL